MVSCASYQTRRFNSVSLGKALGQSLTMLVGAPRDIIRHADIERSVRPVGHDVHVATPHGAKHRVRPGGTSPAMTEDGPTPPNQRFSPAMTRAYSIPPPIRHGRACPGLFTSCLLVHRQRRRSRRVNPTPDRKSWMAGTSPAMTTEELRTAFPTSVRTSDPPYSFRPPHRPSWPGLSRPSTPCFLFIATGGDGYSTLRISWMAGTSPAMTTEELRTAIPTSVRTSTPVSFRPPHRPSWPGLSRPPRDARRDLPGARDAQKSWVAGTSPAMMTRSYQRPSKPTSVQAIPRTHFTRTTARLAGLAGDKPGHDDRGACQAKTSVGPSSRARSVSTRGNSDAPEADAKPPRTIVPGRLPWQPVPRLHPPSPDSPMTSALFSPLPSAR